MASPELELTGEIVALLKADAAVSALIGGRVYDDAAPNATFPYVTIGPVDLVQDDADCLVSGEVTMQLDVWARATATASARAQALRITDAIRAAVREAEIEMDSNALVHLEHRNTRTFRDPDGLTIHSAIELLAIVEQP